MLLIDIKENKIIDAIDATLDIKQMGHLSSYGNAGFHSLKEPTVSIKLHHTHYSWVKSWIDKTSGIIKPELYKKDLFISGKIDMKFINAFPKTVSMNNYGIIELIFTSDCYEIDNNLSELKQIYRDIKIDEILS